MDARRALIVAAGATGALLSAAAPAAADTQISIAGDVLYARNDDAGIANQMTIDAASGGRVHFVDEADPYGFRFPPGECSPGRINSAGNAVEVTCDREGYSRLTIELGPGEDRLSYALNDLPVNVAGLVGADTLTTAGAADSVNGGQGNDTLDTGAGDDVLTGDSGDDSLRGGDGNDRLNGGEGGDVLDAGAGEDQIIAADGVGDTIDCGPGADTVNADTIDRLVNCETEQRQEVAPPPAGSPAQRGAEDDLRPVLQVGGLSSQRVSLRRRRVMLAVSASETALVNVSGFLEARGLNSKVKPASTRVAIAGGGIYVPLTLSRAQVRRALADLRRGKRPRLRLTISAVDAAGNTSPPQRLVVALRR